MTVDNHGRSPRITLLNPLEISHGCPHIQAANGIEAWTKLPTHVRILPSPTRVSPALLSLES